MAISSGDQLAKLFVRVGADISDLKTGLNQAQGEVDKLANGVASTGKKIDQGFSKLGSTFRGAGLALSAGLTAPIVAVGGLALKASMDFETAMAGVSKNVDGTAAEIKTLRSAILDMSKEMPASAKEIANVASAAGQLGVKKADILDFTKTMIMLGTTTNLSADQAATAMAQFANVMQLPEADIEKLASVLVDLGKNGASTEAQIMDMASNIVGAAHTVGVSAQDVLGFANAIASIGIEAQAGGTAISRVFMTLAQAVGSLAPDKEQLDALAQAQRDVRDAGDNMALAQRGVRDAFEAVRTATAGLQTAYQGVLDAQRGVRDASEGVAAAHRSTRDASEALAGAHRNMRNATEGVVDAQRELIRTYRDARQASLDARRETLSVAEAYQGLREVQAGAGDSALEIRSAQLALAQAHKQVADAAGKSGLEQRSAALAVEQAQARLNAVQVRSPRYALDLQNAQLRLAEAQGRVGKSADDYAQKELQASRNVRNAKEGVQDASRGERNASEGVAEARRGERNATEALQAAQRALVAAGANVETASRGLRDAHEGVTDAQKREARAADDLAEAQKKLGNLMDPERLKKIAEVAGMTSEAFADFFKKDPAMATAAFIKGLERMKGEGKDVFKVLDDLGLQDIRVQRTLLGLAGAGDLLTDSLVMDRKEFERNKALQEAYAIKVGTTANQLKIMRNQLEVNMIMLGDKLAPALLSVLKAMGPLNDAFGFAVEIFGKLPKPLQYVILGLAGIAAVVGPLLILIGAMASGVGAIIGVLGFLGISFAGGEIAVTGFALAFGNLMLAALPWIALAAAIVLAGYLIYKNWDTLKELAGKLGKAITDAFGSVLNFLKGNWKKVASLIALPFSGPLVALATDAFGIRSALIKALRSVLDYLGNQWEKIKDLIPKPFKDLVKKADDAFGLKSKFNGALTSIKDTAGGLAKGTVDAVNTELEKIKPISQDSFFEKAKNRPFGPPAPQQPSFFERARQPVFGPPAPTPDVGGGLAEKIREAFRKAQDAASEGIAGLMGTISSNFNAETVGKLFGFLVFLPVTFGKAFDQVLTTIDNFLFYTVPNAIIGAAPGIVQSAGNIGAAIIGGVISGLINAVGGIVSFLAGTLPHFIMSTVPNFIQTGANLGTAIIGGITSAAINAAGGAVKYIVGQFTSLFGADATSFEKIGTSIVEGIVSGISKAGAWLGEQIASFGRGFAQQMNKALGFDAVGAITGGLRAAWDAIAKFFRKIGEIKVNIHTSHGIPTGFGVTLPSYAKGTDNVPKDMLAQIHKGEMVIPRRVADQLRAGGDSGTGGLTSVGSDLIQGLINGVGSKLSVLGKTITSVGADIMQGLSDGIAGGMAPLQKQIQGISAAVVSGFAAASPQVASPVNTNSGMSPPPSTQAPEEPVTGLVPLGGKQSHYSNTADAFAALQRSLAVITASYTRGLTSFQATLANVTGFASGTPYVSKDMLAFIHKGEMVIPRGIAEQMRSGDSGTSTAAASSGGLNIEVNGPLTVQNIGRKQDTKGALGNLAFGVQGQLNRRGVYT